MLFVTLFFRRSPELLRSPPNQGAYHPARASKASTPGSSSTRALPAGEALSLSRKFYFSSKESIYLRKGRIGLMSGLLDCPVRLLNSEKCAVFLAAALSYFVRCTGSWRPRPKGLRTPEEYLPFAVKKEANRLSMNFLLANDSYDTIPRKRAFLANCFFNSRFYFFPRLYLNFYLLGKCARRGLFNREKQTCFSEKNLRIIENSGARIHLRGLNHLSSEAGPFVLVGNHMSMIETALLNAMISPRFEFTYVIKSSLFKAPFLGSAMTAINAIGVNRINARDDFNVIIEEGKKRLKEGCSVLIFPESTRQLKFQAENFNSIGIKLAKNAGVKIIPFALKTDFVTPGLLSSEFGPLHPENQIYFEFGEPIAISGNGKEEHRIITDFITAKTSEWEANVVSDHA